MRVEIDISLPYRRRRRRRALRERAQGGAVCVAAGILAVWIGGPWWFNLALGLSIGIVGRELVDWRRR